MDGERHTAGGTALVTASATVATVGGTPLRQGDHICAFYRGHAERDRLVTSFLAEGLRAEHVCTLLAAPEDARAYRDALEAEVPSLVRAGGRLVVGDPQDTYLRNGAFDADGMLASLRGWVAELLDGGGAAAVDGRGRRRPRLLRIAADMSWAHALVRPGFVRELVAYETRATSWLRACPQVGVCLYDLGLFGGDLIIPMVKAHPRVWLGGMVVENPYYLDQEPGPGSGAGPAGAVVN
ncbi:MULTISPECIES: MEDS domain-containing protein [unclassified Streptomyces]|uniref:MEDS domain-containing protein n=1 Tax=unclassified Streptomyces TaxID=2593676 RepID=UPI00381E37B0